MSPEIVALLATDLGYALKHAARHGVVHRDLSPGNVLVSYDGEIKLSDFGIAKALASGSHSGLVKGKVPYMSPEQASAEPVDARSDLFSLGVILHECLVGRRPFDGKTQVETLSRILQGNRHEAEVESSAAKLLDISDQLIARRPEDRTPNAEELLRSLEAITPGASARARLGELAYEAQPPQARRRSPLVAKAKGKAKAKVEEKLDAITPPSGELETVAGAKADTDRGSGNAPAETTGSNPDDHPVAAREAQPTHTGPSRRTVHLAVGVAAVMVVVAGAVAVWKLGGDASASDGAVLTDAAADGGVHDGGPSDAPAADSGASVREDVPELDAGSDTGAPDSGAVNTTVALGRGTVEVIVLPFGRVWINGRAAGETPLRRELTAGSYRIAGGASRPEVTKRVRVRPGRHSRVVLEWRE